MMFAPSVIIVVFLSILSYPTVESTTESSASDPGNDICPPWFIYNETTSKCQCGNDLGGIVKCNDKEGAQENAIMDCYCMTHNEKLGTIAGYCMFNCNYHKNSTIKSNIDKIYRQLPLQTSELNQAMCEERRGNLCGRCENGSQLSAYSYQMKCIKCSTSLLRNWITYLLVAFLPLTAFFFCVLVFRISAMSPKMATYVLISQVLATPANVRIITQALDTYPSLLIFSKTGLALYGIWNLDFFRTFMTPICLDISTLQVLALDYAVAVYPLGLVVLTYMLIQLHARGCMPLVELWLPFRKCHNKMQSRVDVKTTVIDVFAGSFLCEIFKCQF